MTKSMLDGWIKENENVIGRIKYMISYGKQNISQNDIEGVIEVLKSEWLTQGPKVLYFENAVASRVGANKV